jgi:hypothetical protein
MQVLDLRAPDHALHSACRGGRLAAALVRICATLTTGVAAFLQLQIGAKFCDVHSSVGGARSQCRSSFGHLWPNNREKLRIDREKLPA